MPTQNTPANQDLLFSLQDLWEICKRSKWRVLAFTVLFSLLASYPAVKRSPVYVAESKFREKEKDASAMPPSFVAMMSMASDGDSAGEAISTLCSPIILDPIIRESSLQASLEDLSEKRSLWENIAKNLRVQQAHFRRQRTPCLPDRRKRLLCQDLSYDGEIPISCRIDLFKDGRFVLRKKDEEKTWQGQLETPFTHPDFQLTLCSQSSLNPGSYQLTIQPLYETRKTLASSIKIAPGKKDPSILEMKFSHSDRHLAAEMLNRLMRAYIDYLRSESDRVAEHQLGYLAKRERKNLEELEHQLEKQALSMSCEITAQGFTDAAQALQFYGQSHQTLQARLMALELEQMQIERTLLENVGELERYTTGHEPVAIQEALVKIRVLKQHRDSLGIALHANQGNLSAPELEMQLEQISQLQDGIDEAHLVLSCIQSGQPLPKGTKLLNDSAEMIATWYDRTLASRESDFIPRTAEDRAPASELTQYFNNLIRTMVAHKKMIQERLIYKQSPPSQYVGSDLPTVTKLVTEFHSKLSELQSQIRQQKFTLKQLDETDIELTTLYSLLADPICGDMADSAYRILLTLQDEKNRSSKEQERLHIELSLRRSLLRQHLEQIIAVSEQNEIFMIEKLHALQSSLLDLDNQAIALQEEHLSDYFNTRLSQVQNEREMLELRIEELNYEMARIPSRWMQDELIAHQMDHSRRIVEEVAKLVESKNIAHNLEVVRSMPIEYAVAPILPQSPNLHVYLLVSSFMAALVSLASILFVTLIQGVPASASNLAMQGLHYLGSLGPNVAAGTEEEVDAKDMQTLRRVRELGSKTGLLHIAEGSGPRYASRVADLFGRSGLEVLCIPLAFEGQEKTAGLLQYLNGEVESPEIMKALHHWYMPSGGETRFAHELLQSGRCDTLLAKVQEKYDLVILISRWDLNSAECEALVKRVPSSVLTIQNEKLDDLEFYKGQTEVAFLIAES